MYSECNKLGEAEKIFETIEKKNVISYGSMISGYAKHGKGEKAIKLFEKMIKEDNVKPNSIIFISLFHACSHSFTC